MTNRHLIDIKPDDTGQLYVSQCSIADLIGQTVSAAIDWLRSNNYETFPPATSDRDDDTLVVMARKRIRAVPAPERERELRDLIKRYEWRISIENDVETREMLIAQYQIYSEELATVTDYGSRETNVYQDERG